MTLAELAETLEKKEKQVFNALKKLFSDGEIECNAKTRSYSLTKQKT